MERQLTLGRMTVSVSYERESVSRRFWASPVFKRLLQIYSATWEAKSAGKLPLNRKTEHEPR